MEEKGADVNLAAHLLSEAWMDRFFVAAVVSSDTDLVESLGGCRALPLVCGTSIREGSETRSSRPVCRALPSCDPMAGERGSTSAGVQAFVSRPALPP